MARKGIGRQYQKVFPPVLSVGEGKVREIGKEKLMIVLLSGITRCIGGQLHMIRKNCREKGLGKDNGREHLFRDSNEVNNP